MPNATGIITMAETSTSTAELTIRSPTSSPTGSPLAMELPRLPVNSPPSHSKYRAITGWSRWSSASSAATRSGLDA